MSAAWKNADEPEHLYRLPPERRSVHLARKQSLPIYVFHGFKLLSNWANDVFIIGVIVSFIYYYLFLQGGKKNKKHALAAAGGAA